VRTDRQTDRQCSMLYLDRSNETAVVHLKSTVKCKYEGKQVARVLVARDRVAA